VPKYKVTTLNALGMAETRSLTADRVNANEHYVSLESGSSTNFRVHFVAPREKLIAIDEDVAPTH
jgi:hypothetical protein